jgi:hypothetical protein
MSRYLTPWEFNKLKNSSKSGGSSTSIVDAAEIFDVAEALLARAREPVGPFVGLIKGWHDREGSLIQLGEMGLGIAHRS